MAAARWRTIHPNPSQIRTLGMTELRIAKAAVDSIAVS
jgi:hypothetical protein